MSRSRKLSSRRLSVENLEARELMAGDVHAALVGGNLQIDGGVLSNGVQITAGPTPGTVKVEGLRQAGFATQINHQNGPQVFHLSGDVVIDLGDGDNLLQVDNVCLPGKLKVTTAAGGDSIKVAGSSVGALLLDTGLGNDDVRLTNDTIRGRLDAKLRLGDDYFSMLGSRVGGDMDVQTGWNADRVNIQDSRVGANLNIQGEADFAPKRVTLNNVQVQLALSMQTGDGDDDLRLTGISARSVAINTAGGADHVSLDWVTADYIQAALGAGNDQLTIGNTVARSTCLDGGAGTNHFGQPSPNRLGTLSLTRFVS